MLAVEPGGAVSPARRTGSLVNIDSLLMHQAVSDLSITASADIVVDRPVPMILPSDPDLATVMRQAPTSSGPSATGPAQFLYPSPMIPLDPDIAAWCAQALTPDRPALEAGIDLARQIQQNFTFDPHATMTGTPPRDAFLQRAGVCQDFAQIMIGGLRAAGIPAAYASGYLRTLPPPGEPRLVGADAMHPWVLMWCGEEGQEDAGEDGGRGWIGLDSTNGIFMAEDYIIVAIGRDYSDITPVDGIFTGYGAQNVQVAVDVEPVGMAA